MPMFLVPLVVVVQADSAFEVDDERIANLLMMDGPGVEAVHGMGVVQTTDDPEAFWATVAELLEERRSGT